MPVNKQDALNEILAKQEKVWAKNAKSYPKPGKRKSVLGVHKPTETENSFHDFQTTMNAKIDAQETCLDIARQIADTENKADQDILITELKLALNKLDRYQI